MASKKRRGGKASKKRKETAKRVAARRGLDSLVNQGRQDDNYRNQRAGIESVIQDVSDAPQRFAKNKESRRDFILRNTRPDGSLNSAALAMLAPYDDDRSEYSRDLNRFMKSSPENTRAYAERFPKTYSTMTGLPNIIKNSIPGLGMASRIFEAAQGLRDKPVIKEAVDMFQDVILDPTVNAYNTIADGTPGKTNIQRTFNPENVAVPGSERLSAAQERTGAFIPDVSGYQGGVPKMLSEEEVNELVFDPTTQDQINAMRSFGATDVGGTLNSGQDPVLTNKGSEIVRQSGQDLDIDVDEEVGPMITFKPKPLINIGTDITEEDIQEETQEGTPEGMTPGPEAEAAVDEVVDSFVTRNYGGEDPNMFLNQGYTGSLLNPDIVTNTDENFDTGVDQFGFGTTPEARAAMDKLNSLYDGPFINMLGGTALTKAQGGIASFANGGYNYINGNTMNNESLTASANIDDRIMKNLQYEKMAPGMMGYKNGGLTSLNNSDYNKLKSTYQYMGDF
tara:strand:- start:160 stop:1683 length:1524 start_codon:yes stop_codon:yes gene_type:complete